MIPRYLQALRSRWRLKRAAKRIQAGNFKDSDLSFIAQAFQSNAFGLAPEQTISVSGNANNAVIIAGNGNVVFTLSGSAADTVRQTFLSNPIQIQKGCRQVSERLAAELVGSSLVIRRKELEQEVDRFIVSNERLLFITGDSGVGKSIFAASEAKRLSDRGWAVLLVRGSTFSLEYMTRLIAEDGLGQPLAPGSSYILRQPWVGNLPVGIQGFLMIIDDIVPEKTTNELVRLVDTMVGLPADRVKAVVTCNAIAWQRLNQDYHLPFHKDVATFGSEGAGESGTPQLQNFSPAELTEALALIGATELIPPSEGRWPDAHIDSIRELLTHPGTFGHYSYLRKTENPSQLAELTWSTLIERRLNQALALAASFSGSQPGSLHAYLLQFAQIALEQKSPDFRLPIDLIREQIPKLEVDLQLPTESPLVAMQQAGILLTTSGPTDERLIGFMVSDMGGYLLSFVLEKEAIGKTSDELRQLVNTRVQEAWSYHPLIDALLAWLDRLAEHPDDTKLLILLETLVETHLFNTSSLFRLVRPSLISALFGFIKQKDSGPVFKYREAAYALRPSPAALQEIRGHLRDPDEQSQRVAVKLVGQHKDLAAISLLIDLLGEAEKKFELHSAIYNALATMRSAAIEPLILLVTDLTAPIVLRSRCLIAIRNIGALTKEVSVALTFCFEHAKEDEEELQRNALFTAAHLRDCTQHSAAVASLGSKDWRSVIGATKIIMECGDFNDLPHLYKALHEWNRLEADSLDRTWVIRQLVSALIKIEGEASRNTILDLLRQGLGGTGVLRPVEAVWTADEIDCPGSKALLVQDVVARIAENPTDRLLWQSFNRLGKLWRPNHLNEITSAVETLRTEGTPVAQQVVDAIRDGVKAKTDHPLSDHHAQVAAFKSLAKSRVADFGTEASKLLEDAEWTFDLTICDALWVLADEAAAAALLKKANQHVSGEQAEWLQRSHAMRALSMCATKEFVSPLISYITSESDISIYLPADTIRPLVRRGLITASELKDIIRDPNASTYGRVACLQALSLLDRQQHTDIFAEIAFHQDNEILQDHAIQALGDLGNTDVTSNLRSLLSETQSVSLAQTIADALAQMKSAESVPDIMKTRSRFADEATAFNVALARLGERSALNPLLEVVAGDRLLAGEILDAVGLFLPEAQAQSAIVQKLESFRGPQLDTGEQGSAIEVLAHRDPRLLIDRVSALYGSGRLHKSARRQLGFLMPDLILKEREERPSLIELMKLLICDSHFEVRQAALEGLFRIDGEVCAQIYNDLKSGDEWSRACAIGSLGFWESPDYWINEARRDRELLIRRAADNALAAKSHSADMVQLIRLYQSGNGSDRLAAYLALEENGDYPALWKLYERTDKSSLAYVFLRELSEGVKKYSEERQRKAEKDEADFLSSRGTVRFA